MTRELCSRGDKGWTDWCTEALLTFALTAHAVQEGLHAPKRLHDTSTTLPRHFQEELHAPKWLTRGHARSPEITRDHIRSQEGCTRPSASTTLPRHFHDTSITLPRQVHDAATTLPRHFQEGLHAPKRGLAAFFSSRRAPHAAFHLLQHRYLQAREGLRRFDEV